MFCYKVISLIFWPHVAACSADISKTHSTTDIEITSIPLLEHMVCFLSKITLKLKKDSQLKSWQPSICHREHGPQRLGPVAACDLIYFHSFPSPAINVTTLIQRLPAWYIKIHRVMVNDVDAIFVPQGTILHNFKMAMGENRAKNTCRRRQFEKRADFVQFP